MSEILSQLIRNTKEYSEVCDMCEDEILIYPIISERTKYTQDEVEQITLKRIIDKLQAKEQECEELKSQIDADYEYYSQQLKILRNIIENKEKRNARLFVISNNYLKALEEIDKVINNIFDKCLGHKTDGCTPAHNVCGDLMKILDIIDKTKREKFNE